MPQLNPSTRPEVTVSFKMSADAHKALLIECGYCGCSASAVIRSAVMKEIQHRKAQRKHDADDGIVAGQMSIDGKVHA